MGSNEDRHNDQDGMRETEGGRGARLLDKPQHRALREAFADRLKRGLKEKGWTLGELASRIGVKRGSVAAWTSAQNWPKAAQLHQLGRLFGVRPGYLLDGEGEQDPYVSLQRSAFRTALAMGRATMTYVDTHGHRVPLSEQLHSCLEEFIAGVRGDSGSLAFCWPSGDGPSKLHLAATNGPCWRVEENAPDVCLQSGDKAGAGTSGWCVHTGRKALCYTRPLLKQVLDENSKVAHGYVPNRLDPARQLIPHALIFPRVESELCLPIMVPDAVHLLSDSSWEDDTGLRQAYEDQTQRCLGVVIVDAFHRNSLDKQAVERAEALLPVLTTNILGACKQHCAEAIRDARQMLLQHGFAGTPEWWDGLAEEFRKGMNLKYASIFVRNENRLEVAGTTCRSGYDEWRRKWKQASYYYNWKAPLKEKCGVTLLAGRTLEMQVTQRITEHPFQRNPTITVNGRKIAAWVELRLGPHEAFLACPLVRIRGNGERECIGVVRGGAKQTTPAGPKCLNAVDCDIAAQLCSLVLAHAVNAGSHSGRHHALRQG